MANYKVLLCNIKIDFYTTLNCNMMYESKQKRNY